MTLKHRQPGLGTFAGVFTPSVLTILGIILFLRLSYVVGSTGLLQSLAIILAANLISVLTSFSLAGIATNLRVKGGGDYYLISRTLGLGFGGAIGIVLFSAQAISVGFYCIGFAEAAVHVAGLSGIWVRVFAAAAVVILMIMAWLGTDWATRFQYVVMVLIAAGLGSFVLGAGGHWDGALFSANLGVPKESPPFWLIFAVFFPAVTGFTQGVSMSGDLKDPNRSIPVGTFIAVALSFVVYIGAAVIFAGTLPSEVLATDYSAMQKVAGVPALVDAGIFAATLSSALASFLGAPRILQSLAKDRIFPILQPFARGTGTNANPRAAVIVTAIIALFVVALGNLNAVASIVSMFFLVSYGLLNYATYYEARSRSPFFRPRFKFYDERISLAGALVCLGAMLAIDALAGVIATAVVGAIYLYLRSRGVPARWADSRRSYNLQRAREHLLAAAREPEHPRDWRPQLLVFSDGVERRQRLMEFASWMEGGSGLTTVVTIIAGNGPGVVARRDSAIDALASELKEYGSHAFPLVVAARSIEEGVAATIQAAGIGPFEANTVIANINQSSAGYLDSFQSERYGRNIRTAFRFGCNLLILDASSKEWTALNSTDGEDRTIDIWWTEGATSSLMLILAHLMTRDDAWDRAEIRVLVAGEEMGGRFQRLLETLKDSRVSATAIAIGQMDEKTIRATSGSSTLVFLPITMRAGEPFMIFGMQPDKVLVDLPISVLVLAAEDIELSADPDEGVASETVLAADELADAVYNFKTLERKHRHAARDLKSLRAKLTANEDGDGEKRAALQKDVEEAEATVDGLARKASAAKSAVDDVQRKIDQF